MPSDSLPAEAGRSVELFLTAADELAPGLIAGFYLVGSVALGDFHPSGAGRGRLSTASDIDFVAVTDRRLEPESREMAALARAHARTVARFPRPHFDGAVLTWTDLAAGPGGCPDLPCVQESRFTPAGRSGINPVTFCELAWHGIAVRGPQPAEADLWADRDALRAYALDNLSTYWRPWWRRSRRLRPLPLAAGLTAWFPVWAVLGVSRLHHLLAAATPSPSWTPRSRQHSHCLPQTPASHGVAAQRPMRGPVGPAAIYAWPPSIARCHRGAAPAVGRVISCGCRTRRTRATSASFPLVRGET